MNSPAQTPAQTPAGAGVAARARRLRKRFGTRVAVDGIDFEIPAGQCFGFLGPNGAGKTTTLRMMLGLSTASSGTLEVLGLDPGRQGRHIRARVGVVPQLDNLDPDFTVEENLEVFASYFRLPRARVRERIPQLLEFAALAERRGARTDDLSGGMKRRLTIARALINDPELMVLDEPTTGLDPQARHVIWGRLWQLRQAGKTLVLTTHYMEEAERLCDQLVIMDRGRILERGSPAELVSRHVEPEVVEVRGEGAAELTAAAVAAGCRVERIGTALYCYSRDARAFLQRVEQSPERVFVHRPAGLEDVFLRLTGRELRD